MKNTILFLLLIGIALISCNNEPSEEITPPEEIKFMDIAETRSGSKDNFKTSFDIQIHSQVTHDYYLTAMTVEAIYDTDIVERSTGIPGIDWELASYFKHRRENNPVVDIPVYVKKLELVNDSVLNKHVEFTFPPIAGQYVDVLFILHPVSELFEKELSDNYFNIDINNANNTNAYYIRDTIKYLQSLEDYADLKQKFPESPIRAFILSNMDLMARETAWINVNEKNTAKSASETSNNPIVTVKTSIMLEEKFDYPIIKKGFRYEIDQYGNIKLMGD